MLTNIHRRTPNPPKPNLQTAIIIKLQYNKSKQKNKESDNIPKSIWICINKLKHKKTNSERQRIILMDWLFRLSCIGALRTCYQEAFVEECDGDTIVCVSFGMILGYVRINRISWMCRWVRYTSRWSLLRRIRRWYTISISFSHCTYSTFHQVPCRTKPQKTLHNSHNSYTKLSGSPQTKQIIWPSSPTHQ